MDYLEEMMRLQRELQRRYNGYAVDEQSLEQRVGNIALNVQAATAELHELLAETSWKPWTTGTYINRREAIGEAIDVLHFVLNLFLHLGLDASDVYGEYLTKNAINHRRQDEGYDGVKNKCPQCHRVLELVELREILSPIPVPNVIIYCPCGREVGRRPV